MAEDSTSLAGAPGEGEGIPDVAPRVPTGLRAGKPAAPPAGAWQSAASEAPAVEAPRFSAQSQQVIDAIQLGYRILNAPKLTGTDPASSQPNTRMSISYWKDSPSRPTMSTWSGCGRWWIVPGRLPPGLKSRANVAA